MHRFRGTRIYCTTATKHGIGWILAERFVTNWIAEHVCGGSDDARVQLIAGLKKLSSAAQESLLQEAGLRKS